MSDTQTPLPADEAEDKANSIDAANAENAGPLEEPTAGAECPALSESQAEIPGQLSSGEETALEAAVADARSDTEEQAEDELSDAESEAAEQPEDQISDAESEAAEQPEDQISDAESETAEQPEDQILDAESEAAEQPEDQISDAESEAAEQPEDQISDAESETAEQPEQIDDGREWFVVHSYSGYENKVKNNLEHRIESMNMQDKIFQVVVPTEEEIEIREGNRRRTKKRVFPGYILVQMLMDEESWYVVRNTPGVTGFVGSGTRPSPLRKQEVDKIFSRMEAEAPKIKVSFREGQTVRITDGPFADFVGVVEDMNLDKGKVTVMVSFFGRETPVELDFLQVQKQ